MKNLKKILIVIAVLALLVSSAVVVISAEDDAAPVAGNVKDLTDTLAVIQEDMDKASGQDVAKQATKLADFYRLITNDKLVWDEEDPAYQEALAKAAEYTVTIGNSLYTAVEESADVSAMADTIRALYSHLTTSLAPAETEGLAELTEKCDAANKELIGQHLAVKDRTNMLKIYEQLSYVPLDAVEDADLIAECSQAAYEVGRTLMDDYNALPAHDDAGENVNQALANYSNKIAGILVIRDYVLGVDLSFANEDDVDALIKEINDAVEARNAIVAANASKLDAEASFDSYDLKDIVYKNYDGNLTPDDLSQLSVAEREKYNSENNLYDGINASGEWRTTKNSETINGVENGYQSFLYGKTGTAPHLYFYIDNGAKNEEYGVVLEFDLRMHDTFRGVTLQTVDNTKGTGKSVFDTIIVLTSAGKIENRADQGTVEVASYEGVLVLDAWQHFTITFDNEKRIGKLYVDYMYIMDVDYKTAEDGQFRQLRFGPSLESDWQWDIDNIHMYQGNQYRDTDKFTSMSEADRFDYFAKYAMNEEDGLPYLSRNLAYKKAQILYEKYKNTATAKLFKDYEYETKIKTPAMVENLELLKLDVIELYDIKLDSGTATKVTKLINDIYMFVAENGELINKGDTRDSEDIIDEDGNLVPDFDNKGYQALMAIVYSKEADLKRVEEIKAFVEAIQKFERAQTSAALNRHAKTAIEIFVAAGYADPANRAFAEKDPVVLAFETAYNGNTGLTPEDEGYTSPDSEEYVTIFEFYDMIDYIISNRDEYENSKRIVNGIDYILSLDGYEATREFWAANRASMETYVSIIRQIVATGAYVAEYPGVDEAIAVYTEMDLYFYEVAQQEYVEYLTELVAGYTETQSYIERRSIINAALVYFDPIENPKDLAIYRPSFTEAMRNALEDEMEALSDLEVAVEVYNRELDGFKDSFEDVLEQQTQYFINIINHMDTIDTIADLNELFDEASGYYYGINMNVKGAVEAAERYAYYRDYLAEVEVANAYFTLYADRFMDVLAYKGAAKRDLLFNTINECSEYVDMIDKLDADVKGYYSLFVDGVQEYAAHMLAVNSAIYDSAQFVYAMRSEQISPTVLAIIAGVINA